MEGLRKATSVCLTIYLNPFQQHGLEDQQKLKQLKEKYGVLPIESEAFLQRRKKNDSKKYKK